MMVVMVAAMLVMSSASILRDTGLRRRKENGRACDHWKQVLFDRYCAREKASTIGSSGARAIRFAHIALATFAAAPVYIAGRNTGLAPAVAGFTLSLNVGAGGLPDRPFVGAGHQTQVSCAEADARHVPERISGAERDLARSKLWANFGA
ncbi:unnamed protein product [Phytophthora fragariaefolia]|uniref:Unnamed protein product n=1 Tax=Phytophthora fragariaefolia TaxID=1490495 RepID=A0A9W6XBA7_9STRA|nr:unnamed protein product [Phytophthora fragariaefolia]